MSDAGVEPGGAERRRRAELYEVGRRARVRYVIQFKRPLPGIPVSKCVLEIWIGPPEPGEDAAASGPTSP